MDSGELIAAYKDRSPEWARFLTADAHGYIRAHEFEPKQSPGGLFYSTGRHVVLSSPGYTATVAQLDR